MHFNCAQECKNMKTGCHCLKLAGAAMALYLLIAAAPAFSFSDATKAPTAAPPVTPAEYAGSDACKACHEDLYSKQFELTAHYKTTLQGGHGCESCHGPGGEHVAGGGDLSKIVGFKELTRVSRRANAA